MKSITQDIKYYQAILSYADQHGVTKAAIKYRTYRQFIYRLRNRYDGTPESLAPKSCRLHHHPNEHSDQELALIRRMRKRRPNKSFPLSTLSGRPMNRERRCTNTQRLTNVHDFALLLHSRSNRRIRPCASCSSSSAVLNHSQ